MHLSDTVNDEMFLDLERRPIDQVLSDWEMRQAVVEKIIKHLPGIHNQESHAGLKENLRYAGNLAVSNPAATIGVLSVAVPATVAAVSGVGKIAGAFNRASKEGQARATTKKIAKVLDAARHLDKVIHLDEPRKGQSPEEKELTYLYSIDNSYQTFKKNTTSYIKRVKAAQHSKNLRREDLVAFEKEGINLVKESQRYV